MKAKRWIASQVLDRRSIDIPRQEYQDLKPVQWKDAQRCKDETEARAREAKAGIGHRCIILAIFTGDQLSGFVVIATYEDGHFSSSSPCILFEDNGQKGEL